MKKEATILAIILFVTTGLGGCKQSAGTQSDLIKIDLTANHPKKELILQDFMDVEYIPLETNDEFITQGNVMAVGNKYIIVKNRTNDGNIFIFDRNTGKGLNVINRRGQGGEEYAHINNIILDEDNNELFVNSASSKKILVYDLSGNFKRSFEHTRDTEYLYLLNYDKDNLIRYDISLFYKDGESRGDQAYHAIISKQDGSITREILIPFDVIKAPVVKEGEGVAMSASVTPITPFHNNWLLCETSSDTVYQYVTKGNKLNPFLIKKTTKDPEIFLSMGIMTDRYYFMQTLKKVFDFTKGRGFPMSDLMYDKEEDTVFDITVLNGDFVKKRTVDMNFKPVNNVIASYRDIAAHQLVEAYENDELKGKLKEIAATLDEEANPVIMLMKYKK